MNFYELLFIINPNLSDEEATGVVNKVNELIGRLGGVVFKTEKWGKRKLAYEVKKHKKGYYILMNFNLEPSKASELERTFRLTDPIIRYLIVNLEPPQAVGGSING
ncbi:MAG: 30S ribosomal protein S6 [Nitrospirota bacterium]